MTIIRVSTLANVEGQRLEVARKPHRGSGTGLRLAAARSAGETPRILAKVERSTSGGRSQAASGVWPGFVVGSARAMDGGPAEERGRALGQGALEGAKNC